jgi:C4-dicarboxylate-specific signal transduction histidine kinase
MSARTSKTQNGDLIVTGDLTVLGGINSSTTSKTNHPLIYDRGNV